MPLPEPVNLSPALRLPVLLLLSWLIPCALCWSPAAGAAASVSITRQEPRLFGYQLGDVISQAVEIRLAPGYSLDPQSVPRAGKRAGWFMVRSADYRVVPDDGGSSRILMDLQMQLVNSPKTTRTLTVPPIALRFKGKDTLNDTIPSLTIDAVPLGTGEIRTGLPDVGALRPSPLIPTGAFAQQLQIATVVGAAALAWLLAALLVRRWKPRTLRPFAAAHRELARLARQADSREGACLAIQRLHRAFDLAAGHRLFGEGVPAFCRRLGADSALEERTRAFFATSQALFFAPQASPPPAGLGKELTALCRAWQRFEGRHR